jgi:hypothetical protein
MKSVPSHLYEGECELPGNSVSQQGFAAARGTVQQESAGRGHTQLPKC